jgi:hypothetical protein
MNQKNIQKQKHTNSTLASSKFTNIDISDTIYLRLKLQNIFFQKNVLTYLWFISANVRRYAIFKYAVFVTYGHFQS